MDGSCWLIFAQTFPSILSATQATHVSKLSFIAFLPVLCPRVSSVIFFQVNEMLTLSFSLHSSVNQFPRSIARKLP
jgi:hypothetical protein